MTPDEPSASEARENTDRELWRGPDEGSGSYYADSIHVTAGGGIGIDVGGHVIVKPLRDWHALARCSSPAATANQWRPIETAPKGRNILLDYDGNVVIGGFCRLNQYWTDGENYIPTKDIRGWMPIPPTDKRPPMQEDGK